MEVIVGIAATVAGEDTEDHVEADGDAADDDVVVVDDVRLPVVIEQLAHQDYQLDSNLKQIDENNTFLTLSVRVFLISCFQSRIIESTYKRI